MDFSVIGDMDVHKLHHFLGSPPFTQIYLFQVILIHFTNFVYNQYNSDIWHKWAIISGIYSYIGKTNLMKQ